MFITGDCACEDHKKKLSSVAPLLSSSWWRWTTPLLFTIHKMYSCIPLAEYLQSTYTHLMCRVCLGGSSIQAANVC